MTDRLALKCTAQIKNFLKGGKNGENYDGGGHLGVIPRSRVAPIIEKLELEGEMERWVNGNL